MKKNRISLLLFSATLFLFSCVSEWGDRDCQGLFTLYFDYKVEGQVEGEAEGNPVTFLQHVRYVDVFLFDERGNLAYYRPQIRQADMLRSTRAGTRASARPGIDLPVGSRLTPGGNYRVVVWGNADRQRQAFNQNAINNASIQTALDGGTPLHFGPGALRNDPRPGADRELWITIPNTLDDDYAIVSMTRAHVVVQVFVVNASETPTIGLDNVHGGMYFEKTPTAGRISFSDLADERRATPELNPRQADFTSFYAPLFWENTDKLLQISNSGGALVNGSDISLSAIITGNPPANINRDMIPRPNTLLNTYRPREVVQVVFEIEQQGTGDDMRDVVVNVWMPGWQRVGVTPI